jgi:glycosyltransferase involved in cell wall biosynthesis
VNDIRQNAAPAPARIKVLLVTHYYSPHMGGIEIVAGALASRLAASHDIAWAATDTGALPEACAGLRLVPMRGLNVIERWTGLPFPVWSPAALARLWREVRAADVIHVHDVLYLGNWAAVAIARLTGKPVLLTQHAGIIRYPSRLLRGTLRFVHRTVGRALLMAASRVVFISPVVRAYFASFVRFRRSPDIIWNGVDTGVFTAGDPADKVRSREALGISSSSFVVLFVGRFVEAKGLAVLQRLVERMPDVIWLFAGWGPIDPETWGAPNVRVFRSVSGRTLVPLYHAADLLALPSRGEGLPLVVQEAMACGLPVLVDAETVNAIQAPLGVFHCAVGDANTVDRWSAEIHRIAGDILTRADLSAEVAEFARTRWSWSTAVNRYSTLLQELVGLTGAAALRER